MSWLFLILFIAAVVMSFTPSARNTDKPFGIFCALLLMTAAGLFTAKTGIDLTLNIISRTLTVENDPEIPLVIPSLASCIVRVVLLVPLLILTAVRILKDNFSGREEYTIEDALRRRRGVAVPAAVLMLAAFIAALAMLILHANEIVALGIVVGGFMIFFLLLSLICPVFILLTTVAAGIGIIGFVKLLSTPIMLFFAASSLYTLTVICAVGLSVRAMKLTRIGKPWYILLILLSLVPLANTAVFYMIPALDKK